MDLKNATAVCLISLFSATLVLLIARTLDLQGASKLEPQLAKIVAELEAIRTEGEITVGPGGATSGKPIENGLMVYYFHGDVRCPTCEAIESQSYETVHSEFAAPLKSGTVVWKILNYQQPEGAALAQKFEVHMAVVVLARMEGGQIAEWKPLDQVWALVGDKPAFAQLLRDEISQMLKRTGAGSPAETDVDSDADTDTTDIPVPTDLPIPNLLD